MSATDPHHPAPTPPAVLTPPAGSTGPVVLELAGVRATVVKALLIFAEAVIVPALLLAVLLSTVGLVVAASAALSWVALVVLARVVTGRRVPGTLLVCGSLVCLQAAVLLLSASKTLYLLQPALGSALTATIFLGSAALGRPVTQRLARDFVHLPEDLLARRGVRRMFVQVALIFGLSRVGDVALSLGLLRDSLQAGLVVRGVAGPLLTLLTVAACTWWGWRCLRRDGVRVALRPGAALPV